LCAPARSVPTAFRLTARAAIQIASAVSKMPQPEKYNILAVAN
jgi:hypothetical protein